MSEDFYQRLFNEYCVYCNVKKVCSFYKQYLDDVIDTNIQCEHSEELMYEIKQEDEEKIDEHTFQIT